MSFISALAAIGVTGIAGTIGAGTLMGAGIGAGTSALTGQDIGKGALMGGLTGGIGGGVAGGLSALAPTAELAATGVTDIGASAGNALQAGSGAVADTSAETSTLGASGFGASPSQVVASNVAPQLSVDTTPNLYQGANAADTANFAPNIGANFASNTGTSALSNVAPEPSTMSEKIGAFAAKHPIITGGIGSLVATPFINNAFAPSMPTTQGSTYSTPLHWAGPKPGVFNQTTYSPDIPNPASFYPTSSGYAEGGITNLAAGGMPKYVPAGLPAGLPEGPPSKIQHLAPKGHPASTRYSHSTGMAQGGIADLGSYKSGGSPNLLHGPGDGVSDDIPATIANKQPARLATGEYILSSRIVSELGNGSTDAGAKRLDEMVKHIQAGRKKTIGKNKEYAKDTKAYKHLLA